MASLFPMGFLIAFYCIVNCEFKFTSLDLNVIEKFQKYFSYQCFVFVEDSEDVSLGATMKNYGLLYFVVVNSSRLGKILADNMSQAKFLQRKTIVVTKEDLNLTSLLDRVSHPHFLSWVVFKDHTLSRELCIPVNSDVFFVHSMPEMVSMKQMYHLKCGVNETVRTMEWRDPSFAVKNLNFQGIAMKMIFLTPRENCQNMHMQTLLRKLECVHWDLIELMGEKLNFSVSAVECMEKEFPFIFPNGSDSELFVKIKNREVDFSALGHVISTRGQRHFMDFVWPTFALKSIMYLKQGRLTGRWGSYLKPLETSVWWGILICIFVFGILLQAFERLLGNVKLNDNFLLHLIMSGLKALQVFCNQAISDMPAFWSVRLIYLLIFSVVLVFFQAYCGYLVSSLTVVGAYFPFADLEGFFANPQYKIMTLRKGFHQFYFRKIVGKDRGTDFILQPHELPETIQQAVDKLCEEDHLAFAEFREDLLDFDTLSCKISELPNPVLRLHVGIAMPTSSPLKEFLRRELLTLRSSGILRRFGSRLSSQTPDVLSDRRSLNEFSSVSMHQIFSIFILFGVGVLLSMSAFVFEVIIKRFKRG